MPGERYGICRGPQPETLYLRKHLPAGGGGLKTSGLSDGLVSISEGERAKGAEPSGAGSRHGQMLRRGGRAAAVKSDKERWSLG